MQTGIELIAQERKEQIEKHGYTVYEDVQNNRENQLLEAIMLVVSNVSFRRHGVEMPQEAFDDLRPDGWKYSNCEKFLRKDDIGSLMLIGAWAAAEIDRLQNT